jgi:hypothetical protein
MNREAVWAAVLLLAVAAILIGVNLVLWPPPDPDGPPPGYVIPNVAPSRLPPGDGPGVSPEGDGSGLPRDVTWYNLADDPKAAQTIREPLAKPAIKYGPSRPPTDAEAKEFGDLFARMLTAARKPGDDDVRECFDFRRYFEERIRQWAALRPGKPIPERRRAAWGQSIRKAIDYRIDSPDPKSLPDAARVVRVARSPDGREAVVAVRYAEAGRVTVGVKQWRLARGDAGWRAYDCAGPPRWMWFTASQTEPEKGTTSLIGTADEEVGVLVQVVYLAGGEDTKFVGQQLARVRGKSLTPTLVAWREYVEGYLRLMRGQPAKAVSFFDAAVAADSLWPPAYVARAVAYNRQGKPALALADARQVTDIIGPWPEAVAQEVEALRKLGKPGEADAAHRAALKLFPDAARLPGSPARK